MQKKVKIYLNLLHINFDVFRVDLMEIKGRTWEIRGSQRRCQENQRESER